MTQTIWRIATDTPDYEADDLSGAGAQITGGRWNERGTPMIYASATRALACLETVVHLNAGGLPLNRYLVSITVPDDVWAQGETASSLPVGWDSDPPGRASLRFGTTWLKSGRTALLFVPSVIVPEETNILINPLHRASARLRAIKLRRWLYDGRLQRPAFPPRHRTKP